MARTQNLHARPAIPAEVVRKAIELGIDYESPVTWRRYGWIAQEFYDARLPEPWSEYSDESSQIFYYDHSSGESRWEHPLLSTFRALLLKCEEEPQLLEYYQELYGSLRQYCDDRKGWWALNLLSTPNGGPPPTPEEVRDMAVYLGIDLTLEPDLLWIAKQAVQVALPPNWEELEDGTGAVYFYDVVNGKSTLKHPMDDYFFALAAEERRRLPERRKKTHGQPDIKSVWMPFLDDLGRAYYVHFGLGVVTYYPPWDVDAQRASRLIQFYWRVTSRYNVRRTSAAVLIQRLYRGHVVRDAVASWKAECAVLCIQTMFRMFLARRLAWRERGARTVQRWWRRLVRTDKAKRLSGVAKLQRAFRGAMGRRFARQQRAARDIQRRWRGVRTRGAYAKLLVLNNASREVGRHVRGHLARRHVENMRRANAATAIQAAVRGRKARELAKMMRRTAAALGAVVALQSHFRRRRAMKATENMKQSAAATRLQAAVRGLLARGEARRMRAARSIQSAYRGLQARKYATFLRANERERVEQSATTIQRLMRGKLARKAAREEKSKLMFVVARLQMMCKRMIRRRRAAVADMFADFEADMATRVQSKWRMILAKRDVENRVRRKAHETRASALIQRIARGMLARREASRRRSQVAKLHRCATSIQARMRTVLARKELHALRDRAGLRAQVLAHLVPLYAALGMLPLEDPRFVNLAPAIKERVMNHHVLMDVLKAGHADDMLSEDAIMALRTKQAVLVEEAKMRQARIHSSMSQLHVLYRLLSVPPEQQFKLPPKNSPGFLAAAVEHRCQAEWERMEQAKLSNLGPLVQEARTMLRNLWDELHVSQRWRDCFLLMEVTDVTAPILDAHVEELRRLEEVYQATLTCSTLMHRRDTLLAAPVCPGHLAYLRANSMRNTTASGRISAANFGALPTTAKDWAREYIDLLKQMQDQVSALRERCNTTDMPMSFSEICEMCAIPKPDEIAEAVSAEESRAKAAKEDRARAKLAAARAKAASAALLGGAGTPRQGAAGASPGFGFGGLPPAADGGERRRPARKVKKTTKKKASI